MPNPVVSYIGNVIFRGYRGHSEPNVYSVPPSESFSSAAGATDVNAIESAFEHLRSIGYSENHLSLFTGILRDATEQVLTKQQSNPLNSPGIIERDEKFYLGIHVGGKALERDDAWAKNIGKLFQSQLEARVAKDLTVLMIGGGKEPSAPPPQPESGFFQTAIARLTQRAPA